MLLFNLDWINLIEFEKILQFKKASAHLLNFFSFFYIFKNIKIS
jgi:hypothetical protein